MQQYSINICYIDDRIDSILERYLDEYCKERNRLSQFKYNLYFSEYEFGLTDNYKTLLSDSRIKDANIIVIDSKLFENDRVGDSKFTGEQFKIILKQVLPFIKTVVLTQNELTPDALTIKKFQDDGTSSWKKYYDDNLAGILNRYILASMNDYKKLKFRKQFQKNEEDRTSIITDAFATININFLSEEKDKEKNDLSNKR